MVYGPKGSALAVTVQRITSLVERVSMVLVLRRMVHEAHNASEPISVRLEIRLRAELGAL